MIKMTYLSVFISLLSFECFGEAASRLRVVLINDGMNSHKRGADLSVGCDGNRGGWENFLTMAFESAPNRLSIDVIQGDDASPTGVRNFFSQFQVENSENVFVYYCGHGGWDRARGHFLMFGLEGNFLRSELRQLLLDKRPRGIILMTDACTSFADFEFFPQAPETQFPMFYDLFLIASGLIDISSSSMGQESWFSKLGSVFSSELSLMIARGRDGFDDDKNGTVTWREFFPKLKEGVEQSFLRLKSGTPAGSAMKNSRAQSPAYYFLNEWPEHQKRVVFENTSNERVRIEIHYFTFSIDSKMWQWLPGDPGQVKGLNYEVGPRQSTPLLVRADVPLVAAQVKWEVRGVDSQKVYSTGNSRVTPPEGYSATTDPNAVFKISAGDR